MRGLNFQQNAGNYLHRAYTQWNRISGSYVYNIEREKNMFNKNFMFSRGVDSCCALPDLNPTFEIFF